jgi:acyl dehydratase
VSQLIIIHRFRTFLIGSRFFFSLRPNFPDDLAELFYQELATLLKVAPVSTKYLSLVNSSVRNIKPAFAGKCIAVAVACVEKAAEPKGVRRRISFPTKNRAECTC